MNADKLQSIFIMYCQIYNQRKRKICYSEKTHSKKIRRIGTSYFSRASYSISIYHMCFAVVFPRSTVHYRLGRTSTHTSVKEIATLWLYLFFSLTYSIYSAILQKSRWRHCCNGRCRVSFHFTCETKVPLVQST